MSYNCEICKRHFNGQPKKVITKKRVVHYKYKDYMSKGWETANQIYKCSDCKKPEVSIEDKIKMVVEK